MVRQNVGNVRRLIPPPSRRSPEPPATSRRSSRFQCADWRRIGPASAPPVDPSRPTTRRVRRVRNRPCRTRSEGVPMRLTRTSPYTPLSTAAAADRPRPARPTSLRPSAVCSPATAGCRGWRWRRAPSRRRPSSARHCAASTTSAPAGAPGRRLGRRCTDLAREPDRSGSNDVPGPDDPGVAVDHDPSGSVARQHIEVGEVIVASDVAARDDVLATVASEQWVIAAPRPAAGGRAERCATGRPTHGRRRRGRHPHRIRAADRGPGRRDGAPRGAARRRSRRGGRGAGGSRRTGAGAVAVDAVGDDQRIPAAMSASTTTPRATR